MPEGLVPGPAHPLPFTLGFPAQPAFDVIEVLPPNARAKLRALRLRSQDAHSLIPLFEQIHEASEAKQNAERALKRLTDHRSVGGFELSDEDGRTIAAQKTVNKATAELRRLTALQTARSQAWQETTAALQRIERWLRDDLGGGVLQDHEHAMPRLGKDENLLHAIADRRRQITELKAGLATIANAPRPSSFCKERARMQIAKMAAKGSPSLESLILRGGDIGFAHTDMNVPIIAGNKGSPVTAICAWEQADAMATLVWLFRDQLLKKLDSEIDAASDDGAALDDDERERRQSEVQASLLACEYDLAALIWEAQRQGLPIEFPADCAPQAILSVQLVTARPVDAPRGSSFDHALQLVGLR